MDDLDIEALDNYPGAALISLDPADFEHFLRGKQVPLRGASVQRMLLVLPKDQGIFSLEKIDDAGAVDRFLNLARVARPGTGGMLRPVEGSHSLREILLAVAAQMQPYIPPVSLSALKNHNSPYLVWHDDPTDAFQRSIESGVHFFGNGHRMRLWHSRLLL